MNRLVIVIVGIVLLSSSLNHTCFGRDEVFLVNFAESETEGWGSFSAPFSDVCSFDIGKKGPAGKDYLVFDFNMPEDFFKDNSGVHTAITKGDFEDIIGDVQDIKEYTYLTFWAKAENSGGDVGLTLSLTAQDSAFLSQASMTITLTKEWKEYKLLLKDFTYAWGNDALKGQQLNVSELVGIMIILRVKKGVENKGTICISDIKLKKKELKDLSF